jgi:hypothetical protein
LFIRGNALTAQRFDLNGLRLEGEPRVIDHQLVSPAVVGRTDAPFSASTIDVRKNVGMAERASIWRSFRIVFKFPVESFIYRIDAYENSNDIPTALF